MPSESYHTDNSQTPSGNISPSQTRTEISQHTSISPPSPSVPTGQNPLQIQDGLPLPSRYWAILSIALGLTVSVLDDVPGVGPTRKRALMRHFGSMKRLRAASEQEIAEVRGIPADVAKAVHEALVAWNAERAEAAAGHSDS